MRKEQLGLTAAAAWDRTYGKTNTAPAIRASTTGTLNPTNSSGERRRLCLGEYMEVSRGFEGTRGFVSILFPNTFQFLNADPSALPDVVCHRHLLIR